MFLFLVRFNSDKTDLESTHSSNASSGIDKSHQVIPPDALYSMKNSNAGYISYEAVFNDSKVSFYHIVNSCNKKSLSQLWWWWFPFQLLNPPDDIEMI